MTETRLSAWLLKRVALRAPVIFGVTALTFALIHLAPGDPLYVLAGDGGSAAYYEDMRGRYGLDRPLPEQFLRYASAILTGDFGHSFVYQAPVARVLLAHAPATVLLGATALTLALLAGLTAGVLAATATTGLAAIVFRLGASAAYSAPVFWTGQLLILLAAVTLGILPAGGMTTARETLTGMAALLDVAWHLVLPAFVLSIPFAAVVARITRAGMIEMLRDPLVTAAHGRGLPRRRVVLRHALPHALVPVVALVGQHAGQIIAGAALVEALFGWPGLGHLVLHASLHRDYPLVTAAFLTIASSVVIFNALADAACAWLDPRVRLA